MTDTHLKFTKVSDLNLDKEIEKDLNICYEMYMNSDTESQFHQTLKHRLDILQEYIPAHYSTKFKNPCWYDFLQIPTNLLNQPDKCLFPVSIDPSQEGPALEQLKTSSKRYLHCLPAFFLSGFPRCASTALYRMIIEHPLVAHTGCKACGFWSRIVSQLSSDNYKRIYSLWYFNLFSQSMQANESNRLSITFDASPYNQYLSDDYCVLPVLLKRVLPEAKFILIMRNPSERYFSHYWFITIKARFVFGTEFIQYVHTKEALETFHDDTVDAIKQFLSCVDNENSITYCVIHEKAIIYAGLQHSLYYYHIVLWLKIIPRERFLFLQSEDLACHPSLTMSTVWHFLNLDDFQNSGVVDNIDPVIQGIAIPPQTRELLDEFFQPYNQLLAHLLADTRFLWEGRQDGSLYHCNN